MEVLGHDRNTLGVDCAKVGVLEESNKVGFGGFLESKHCLALESDILLELSCNFSNEPLEGEFPDEKVSLNYQAL
jgi:hypothetical protein